MKWLLGILVTFLAGWAGGQMMPLVQVDLQYTASSTTLTGTNLLNGSEDTINYSNAGTLRAEFVLDPVSEKITYFQLTGGRISTSDFDATGTLLVLPITARARGLLATPGSFELDKLEDPLNGQLTLGVHFFKTDGGLLTFTNSLGVETFRRDYAQTSFIRTFGGILTVNATPVAENSMGQRYLIQLEQDNPIDEDLSLTESIMFRLRGTSNSTAEGEAIVISEEAKTWARDSAGLDFINLKTVNSRGAFLALLYALGQDADEELLFTVDPTIRSCTIDLGAGNPRLPVFLEVSSDLTSASWEVLTKNGESSLNPTLTSADSGRVTIPLPDNENLFVRLRPELP